jgi:hypothetical protein
MSGGGLLPGCGSYGLPNQRAPFPHFLRALKDTSVCLGPCQRNQQIPGPHLHTRNNVRWPTPGKR